MPNHEVDWEDAPLPYKLYRNVPIIPLSLEIPFSLPNSSTTPTLKEIGHYLWCSFGLTQLCQLNSEKILFRRSIPSGGALYPNELYIYLKLTIIQTAFTITTPRITDLFYFAKEISILTLQKHSAIVVTYNLVLVFAFVSTMFWKNYFKYNNFSYRLQGLDSGVLIGQLLECAKQFGYTNGVYFQFLDRAINHLLGLSEGEESVYAVVPFSTEPQSNWFHNDYREHKTITSHELLQQIPPLAHEHFVRSKHVNEYPMITKINEASMIESTAQFQTLAHEEHYQHHAHAVQLPKVERLSYDFLQLCKNGIPLMLTLFLQNGMRRARYFTTRSEPLLPYYNDIDGQYVNENVRVSLYGCFYNVKDIENGAYTYNSKTHSIQSLRYGDLRYPLQSSMTMDNVNLFKYHFAYM